MFCVLGGGGGEGRAMETYLCKPTSQKRANEKLEPLQLGLNDDQSKIRLGISVPRLRLYQINLLPLLHQPGKKRKLPPLSFRPPTP